MFSEPGAALKALLGPKEVLKEGFRFVLGFALFTLEGSQVWTLWSTLVRSSSRVATFGCRSFRSASKLPPWDALPLSVLRTVRGADDDRVSMDICEVQVGIWSRVTAHLPRGDTGDANRGRDKFGPRKLSTAHASGTLSAFRTVKYCSRST